MKQELPPGMGDDEIEELASLVADGLVEGKDPSAMAQQLVDSGWEPEQANGFIANIQLQLLQTQSQHEASEGGGGMGWLIWIGIVVLINILRWAFR